MTARTNTLRDAFSDTATCSDAQTSCVLRTFKGGFDNVTDGTARSGERFRRYNGVGVV